MPTSITGLTDELLASAVTDADEVLFAIDNTGDSITYKMKLSELQKLAGGAFVDVRAHGATGDGVTVDSVAVLAAIASAPSGGTVLFPSGTYVCSSSWTAPSIAKDLTIVGEEGALIIGPTDAGTDNNFVNLTEGYNLNIAGLKFRQFHSVLQLEANTTTQHETIKIVNCEFDGPYYAVADAGGAGQNNVIERFEFISNRVHDTTRAPKRGVVVRFIDHKHVIIKDNYFKGIVNNDIAAAVWVGSASTTGGESCEVSNNYIDGVSCSNDNQDTHGIFVFSAVTHIVGNVIKNVANNNNGEDCEGIYVKAACPVISGNYLEDAGSEAFIYFKGALSGINKGGVIQGNTLRRVSATLATIGARGGFGISTINPCLIVDNDIDGMLGGIFAYGADGVVISNNRITNTSGTTETIQGIRIEDCSNVNITGNVLDGLSASSGGGVYGIRLRRGAAGTSTNISITSNIISDIDTSATDEMGIGLQGDTSANLTNVHIAGNQIEGCDQGVGVITGGANISNVVATGNNFQDCGVDYESTMATLASVSSGNGVVDVRVFGATGDGVTDDTAAIQAALDAAETIGEVRFPAGEYIISSTLTIPHSGCKFVGTGRIGDLSFGAFPEGKSALIWQGQQSLSLVSGDINDVADTITVASHGWNNGDEIQLATTGTLPGGLSAGDYFVEYVDDNTIKVATTRFGTAETLTSATGSGTHTITHGGVMFEITGRMCRFQDLDFFGKKEADSDRASVCFRMRETSGVGTGKFIFDNVSFWQFDHAMMTGTSRTSANCDESGFYSCDFRSCGNAITTLSNQNMGWNFFHPRCYFTDTFCRIEAGGLVCIDYMFAVGFERIIYVTGDGTDVGTNSGRFIVNGIKVDGNQTTNPIYYEDVEGGGRTIVFNDISQDTGAVYDDGNYHFVLKSNSDLFVNRMSGLDSSVPVLDISATVGDARARFREGRFKVEPDGDWDTVPFINAGANSHWSFEGFSDYFTYRNLPTIGNDVCVAYASGSGSPAGSVTPGWIGQEYLDTSGNAWYKAYGLTNTDWQAL